MPNGYNNRGWPESAVTRDECDAVVFFSGHYIRRDDTYIDILMIQSNGIDHLMNVSSFFHDSKHRNRSFEVVVISNRCLPFGPLLSASSVPCRIRTCLRRYQLWLEHWPSALGCRSTKWPGQRYETVELFLG